MNKTKWDNNKEVTFLLNDKILSIQGMNNITLYMNYLMAIKHSNKEKLSLAA